MNPKAVNIVWLKRDLRSQDHEPLFRAECAGIPYLIIYLFEPSRIEYPDTSQRHLQFVYHSIGNLNKVLSEFNRLTKLFYFFITLPRALCSTFLVTKNRNDI